MIGSRVSRALLVLGTVAASVCPASAQVIVTDGPPPEIRALVTDTLQALNGDADAWEAFAKARFTARLLEQRTADERRQMHARLRADLGGALTLERVERRGPDAPLELIVNGASGGPATVALTLDGSNPPRIDGLSVTLGNAPRAEEGGGVEPPPVNGRMAHDGIARALDAYLTALSSEDVFSGVALVAYGGQPIFHKAYGYADRARRVPNSTQTRFNVGSINKTFTQLAIEQLSAAGKVRLTDTLGTFFPDYPQAVSRSATIEQLLTHRGGLADFFGEAFTNTSKARFRSNADYFRFIGEQPPRFAPGDREQYCNGCYIALGEIIAKASGMSYEDYVARHIFEPADMGSTGYPATDAVEPDIAIGYTRRGGGTLRSNVLLHGATGSAAGGGFSTASDLLAYVNAIRAGRLVRQRGPGLGIAGGAPGTSAVVEADGDWTVIVLSNLDPPTGEEIGLAISRALSR